MFGPRGCVTGGTETALSRSALALEHLFFKAVALKFTLKKPSMIMVGDLRSVYLLLVSLVQRA
jgi:hypothetical protein